LEQEKQKRTKAQTEEQKNRAEIREERNTGGNYSSYYMGQR